MKKPAQPYQPTLGELRDSKGISQPEMAEHLGIKQPHMSQIESGKVTLSAERAAAIGKKLQVTTDEVIAAYAESKRRYSKKVRRVHKPKAPDPPTEAAMAA